MQIALRPLFAAWLALLAAGVFRGCEPTPTPITSPVLNDDASSFETPDPEPFPEDSHVITILHTNDVRGEVDPCG